MFKIVYKVVYSNEFKRNLKAVAKRGYNMDLLAETVDLLRIDGNLPRNYKKHKLTGKYNGYFECHIQPGCFRPFFPFPPFNPKFSEKK